MTHPTRQQRRAVVAAKRSALDPQPPDANNAEPQECPRCDGMGVVVGPNGLFEPCPECGGEG